MKRLAITLACAALTWVSVGQASATTVARGPLKLQPTANANIVYVSTAKTAPGSPRPPKGARILILAPFVDFRELGMAGMSEPKAEWTQKGRDNIAGELKTVLQNTGHPFQELKASDAMDGRNGQLLRLSEAVGGQILVFNYTTPFRLPTKKLAFDWTIGNGAQSLADTYGADYALFTYAAGTWSSGGRKVAFIAMAALGAALPMGQQQVAASLVDLHTGQIIWFNMTIASPAADMRTAAGAHSVLSTLLKDAPL